MRNAWVRIVGFVLIGLIFLGLGAAAYLAVLDGRLFVGANVRWVAIPAWGALLTVGAVAAILLVWLAQRASRWFGRRSE